MKIELEPVNIEIPCTKNGKRTYRLVKGFFVIVNGNKIYPPMRIREAKKYVKSLEARRS